MLRLQDWVVHPKVIFCFPCIVVPVRLASSANCMIAMGPLKVYVQTELKLPKVGECLMPSVKVRDNEPFDVALRRFKRSCEKAGVLSEVRRREQYEKPTAERKRKAAAAVKRHAKKLQRERKRFERLY